MLQPADVPIRCARCKEITFQPVYLRIPPYDQYVLHFTVVCPECAIKAQNLPTKEMKSNENNREADIR